MDIYFQDWIKRSEQYDKEHEIVISDKYLEFKNLVLMSALVLVALLGLSMYIAACISFVKEQFCQVALLAILTFLSFFACYKLGMKSDAIYKPYRDAYQKDKNGQIFSLMSKEYNLSKFDWSIILQSCSKEIEFQLTRMEYVKQYAFTVSCTVFIGILATNFIGHYLKEGIPDEQLIPFCFLAIGLIVIPIILTMLISVSWDGIRRLFAHKDTNRQKQFIAFIERGILEP